MVEDYREYLSIDNGHGILISKDDAVILKRYHIPYLECTCLKELMTFIEECLNEFEDEDLEMVLDHLSEVHYYQEINK